VTSGNDVGRYKIGLEFGVGTDAVSVAADAHLIYAVPHGGAGLYLYPPEATSAPHDEIIGMVVTIGLATTNPRAMPL
jgi:hypothetical protein